MTGTSPDKRWTPSLCRDCPVPEITRANACDQMVLEARVERRLLGLRRAVAVTAVCRRCDCDVAEPHIGCGQCHLSGLNFTLGEPDETDNPV